MQKENVGSSGEASKLFKFIGKPHPSTTCRENNHFTDLTQRFWKSETLHCFGISSENLDATNGWKEKVLNGRKESDVSKKFYKHLFRKEPVISVNT